MSHTEDPLANASFGCHRARATGIRSVLRSRLPSPLNRLLRFLVQLSLGCVRLLLDGRDILLGRRKELVPPRYLQFVGDGDFEKTGDEFLRYFISLGGVQPEHTVLEVSCGIGRMARPLTKYLVAGSYEGIDIVSHGIRWCQRHISSRYPNFRFQVADIQNLAYNPRGQCQPPEYRFPFEDRKFHFIFLTSVFTHMLKRDVDHYLREIARTLHPNGKCLITFLLLNEESRKLINAGLSSLNFQFSRDGCWTVDEHVPEVAVAFEEASIRTIYSELGFTVETVRYGAWCGRADYLSYQDIIVARRT